MKVAVISDIHGNFEALKAVEKRLEEINPDEIWCLGDIVGYGPDPEACVEWVKRNCSVVIAGNHDWAACGLEDISFFNPVAKEAILWTRENLSHEALEFLKNLPLTAEKGDFFIVHSTPKNPSYWDYIFTEHEAFEAFKSCKNRIILVGHSHVPCVFSLKNNRVELTDFPVRLDEGRHIINPGSVGQPRDRDPRACFGVIEDKIFRLERTGYDIEETQRKMIELHLPPFLAQRLSLGI